ncbi:MAG: FtsB family cell division protein [Actinomycetota bacterium]
MSAQVSARAAAVVVQSAGGSSVRFNTRAVALLLMALAVMLLAIAPLRGYLDERGQLADLKSQATALERQNQTLQERIDRLSDATFLERIARECMGMVKPGETAFVIVPAHGEPDPPDC